MSYAGRKIRIEGQEDLPNKPIAVAEDTSESLITLGEAASKGLLKQGMKVVFKECLSTPINLDKEMIGVKQQIECELTDGVVYQKEDGSYAILSVLKVKKNLALGGRWARANAIETIKYIVRQALKNQARFFGIDEFFELGSNDAIITSYMSQCFARTHSILFYGDDDSQRLIYCEFVLKTDCVLIHPDQEKYYFQGIAISIEAQNIKCRIEKNSPKRTTNLYSYFENPHKNRVEIEGIMQ